MSATKIGINFRATAGYVTDDTDETYCIGDSYPVTRGGWTFGHDSFSSTVDRSTSVDRRLAGSNFISAGNFMLFRVDLPAAGSYWVRLAMGDQAGTAVVSEPLEIRDTTTVLTTFNGASVSPPDWYDATNTNYSAANWPTSNTRISQTFSTTIFRLYTNAGPFTPTFMSHIEIEQQGGGGGTPSRTDGMILIGKA